MSHPRRLFITCAILRGLLAPHDPVLFYLFFVFFYLQVLATGKPGHPTKKVCIFGIHSDATSI